MTICITSVKDLLQLDFEKIENENFWDTSDEKELKIHRIHSYPAKFPSFITQKAFEYVEKGGGMPKLVADIFCGCGTVAYESKRNGIDFWGCDINPVATMIATTKSTEYKIESVIKYRDKIVETFNSTDNANISYDDANARLKYWYFEHEYKELARIKAAIVSCTHTKSKYRSFFLCAFSNILKATSRWLTKSIKPQIDPVKTPMIPMKTFLNQVQFMVSAFDQSNVVMKAKTKIVTGNFLNSSIKRPLVDMIITSPPYVTSYEYADLHQLSSLWLEYTDDHRKLREGSVGSLYHNYEFEKELKRLNKTGSSVTFRMLDKDKSQARSIAKYYLDMQDTVKACNSMLNKSGTAFFVMGDTEYKGIRIENARHLAESLLDNGFQEVRITKRKISNKILTPYRDEAGRFSRDSTKRKIYSEEFIVIGRKQ